MPNPAAHVNKHLWEAEVKTHAAFPETVTLFVLTDTANIQAAAAKIAALTRKKTSGVYRGRVRQIRWKGTIDG